MSVRAKSHYNEAEAAEALGISIDQFRSLLRLHLGIEEGEMPNVPQTVFQPSDLLVLKFLANRQAASTTA